MSPPWSSWSVPEASGSLRKHTRASWSVPEASRSVLKRPRGVQERPRAPSRNILCRSNGSWELPNYCFRRFGATPNAFQELREASRKAPLTPPNPSQWPPRAPARESSRTDPNALQDFPGASWKPLRPAPATHQTIHENTHRSGSLRLRSACCTTRLSQSSAPCLHQAPHMHAPHLPLLLQAIVTLRVNIIPTLRAPCKPS